MRTINTVIAAVGTFALGMLIADLVIRSYAAPPVEAVLLRVLSGVLFVFWFLLKVGETRRLRV